MFIFNVLNKGYPVMSTPGINDLASERNRYCVKVFELYLP